MEGVYKRMGDPIMVDGRGKLMLGCRRLPGVWRGRLGGVPRTRPGRPYPAPHCLHRGGGSREPGPPSPGARPGTHLLHESR